MAKKERPSPASASEGGGFDMTPMIDVTFLLIVFFMLVTDIANRKPKVTLPNAVEAKEDKLRDPGRLVISIMTEGDFATSTGGIMSDPDLSKLLQAEAATTRVAGQPPSRAVIIRADKEVEYRHVQKLMAMCIEKQLWKIAFSTKDQQ